MKTHLLIFLLVLMGYSLKAQKIVDNPTWGYSTVNNLKVSRVTITDTATILDFEYTSLWPTKFGVPKGSFIRANNSDKKLMVVKTIDIPLNRNISIAANETKKYKVVFPPIDGDVKSIDFGESNIGGNWYVFNIDLGNGNKEKDVFFKNDTAKISGYIKGYKPEMARANSHLYINNHLTSDQEDYNIEINEEGYFSLKFPLRHPQFIGATMRDLGQFYLEPGKELFVFVDRTNSNNRPQFFGDCGDINNDLKKDVSPDGMQLYKDMNKGFAGMSPEQYIEHMQSIKNKYLAIIKRKADSCNISTKAYNIIKTDFLVRIYTEMFEYNMRLLDNFRMNNPGVRITSEIYKANQVELNKDYFSFLDDIDFNDRNLLVSSNYYFFLNRLKHSELFKKEYVRALNTKKSLRKVFEPIIGKGISLDIITTNGYLRELENTLEPLTEEGMAELQEIIDNEFIKDYLKLKNEEVKAKLISNKSKTGYTIHETPKVPKEKVFDAIMEKYKGKLVFVSIWPGAGARALGEAKLLNKLQKEYNKEDLVILYLAAPYGPEKSWKNFIPEMKGEHYRVDQEKWGYLSQKYGFG